LKFSIIIPTLNEEKLLPNLLKQLKYENISARYNTEIIISDGGSADKTIEIARQYADIVTIHKGEHRQNIAEGRNEGAKIAAGDVFIFINADIIIADIDAFFYEIINFVNNKKYLALTCSVKVFPEEEKLIDRIYHTFYNKYFKSLNAIGVGMGRGECQVIRKEVFNKVNGYNKVLAAGEDFDLFRRVRKLGKILFLSNMCVYESPRRYRKLGYWGVTWSWLKNSFSVLIKKKSLSREWEAIR
jgi:glycosyltransferase involved in cell wall biosynthesis